MERNFIFQLSNIDCLQLSTSVNRIRIGLLNKFDHIQDKSHFLKNASLENVYQTCKQMYASKNTAIVTIVGFYGAIKWVVNFCKRDNMC